MSRESLLAVYVDDMRVERAAQRWWGRCPIGSTTSGPTMTVGIAVDRTQTTHPHGYRLTVSAGGIELLGGSPDGCFYGLQTLTQLTDFATGEVPCCVIDDFPDFTTRGLLHDVTRGKVPTLDTLK
ncbi:MAG: glycoside hydrolase family 20 zincin-like fold domain-containing protein, partial [Planctomycetota bacterium]